MMVIMGIRICLCVAAVVYWVLDSVSAGKTYTGDGTAYTLSQPRIGNCNFMTWPKVTEREYVAMNKVQYANNKVCGRCVKVKCIDSRCTSRREKVVPVVDQCPGCKHGDLDMSPSVFKYITGSHPSRLTISWRFVDCPRRKKYICTKGGSSIYWLAVQPVNFETSVKRVIVNGESTNFGGIDAYYFQVSLTKPPKNLNKVRVSLELDNKKYTSVLSLREGQCSEFHHESTGIITPPKSTQRSGIRTTKPTIKSPMPTFKSPEPSTTAPDPIVLNPSNTPSSSSSRGPNATRAINETKGVSNIENIDDDSESAVIISAKSEENTSGISTATVLLVLGFVCGVLLVALTSYFVVQKRKQAKTNATKSDDAYTNAFSSSGNDAAL